MKLAILADIHGNHLALAAVLRAAREAGVDELLIAGDHVGYYFHPGEVLQLLDAWDKTLVRGNHEDFLAEARKSLDNIIDYERRYGSGVRVALAELSGSELDALGALPATATVDRDGCRVLICHGSPWDVDQYIYPDSDEALFDRCAQDDVDMVIAGHSHHPVLRRSSGGVFLNPGSVGQPRDRKPGAAWALFDSRTGDIEPRRESYDIDAVADEARRRHPELPYLSDVLLRR